MKKTCGNFASFCFHGCEESYKTVDPKNQILAYTTTASKLHRTQESSMKRFFSILVISILTVSLLTAAVPVPNTTFTLVQGLPATMNIGESYTVIVQVDSDQQFVSAQAMPSFQYAGKGVVAVQGGSRVGSGTSATLAVTFKAKSPTARMAGGVAPVYVVVGVRYGGGYVAVQEYVFNVTVP
jgi:hypothetical protein